MGVFFTNISYDVTSYSTHLQIIKKTLVPQMLSGYWVTIHAHPGIAAELNLKRRNSKTNVVLRAGICNESKTWQNEKNILEVEKTMTLFGAFWWCQFDTFESIWHPPSIHLMPFTLLASKCRPHSPLGIHLQLVPGFFQWNPSLSQFNGCPFFCLRKWPHTWWLAAGWLVTVR